MSADYRAQDLVSRKPGIFGRHWTLLGLCLAVCAATGCSNVTPRVVIDNTAGSTMVVKIDGKKAAEVPPYDFVRLPVLPGRYEFEVLSGGRQAFKGTRIIEDSESCLVGRNYLFNPLSSKGYAVCKVVYGSTALSDLASGAVVSFVEYQTGQEVDENRLIYNRLRGYAQPMSSTVWFEIPKGTDYLLRDAPQVAYTNGGSTNREVLTRISKTDHARLKQLHRVEKPTEAHIEDLYDLTVVALDSLSNLESSDY